MKGAVASTTTVVMAVMLFSMSAGFGADMRQSGEPLQPTVDNVTEEFDTAEQQAMANLTGASEATKPLVRSMFDIGKASFVGMKIGYDFPVIGRLFQVGGIGFIILYLRYMHRRHKRQMQAHG